MTSTSARRLPHPTTQVSRFESAIFTVLPDVHEDVVDGAWAHASDSAAAQAVEDRSPTVVVDSLSVTFVLPGRGRSGKPISFRLEIENTDEADRLIDALERLAGGAS